MTSFPPLSSHLPSGRFNLGAIGRGLAFSASLQALEAALEEGRPSGAVVVQAPPGTGKTTLVPPLVANITGLSEGRRVVVTQPRRIAARAAARRLAALDGSPLGGHVGFTVRGERKTGPHTLVEFVTPGILLRRLLADPGLESTAAVILDEVHERGLETDLLLGLLAEVRELRGDLVLVAMSATLDAPRFARLLGAGNGRDLPGHDGGRPAPVVDCPSALYPLDIQWQPAQAPRLDERGVTRAFLHHIADTAAAAHGSALAAAPATDALVFVPGAGEVRQVAARLRDSVGAAVEVLELHGQAPATEQDRAVSGRAAGGLPRIIVSTDLAESSLTVPGVRLVIDSGLTREPRRDVGRGMEGLVTVSCSRASAEQRAGRAARQGPGTVVRCYDQRTLGSAPAHVTPEISVADLTGAALILACWGSPGGQGLTFPDAPPPGAMANAVEVLRGLGAVDAYGAATKLGKALVRIPADPRLARALLDGATAVGLHAAAEAVALVSGDQRAPGADLTRLLAGLKAGADPASRRWTEETRRLEAVAKQEGAGMAAAGAVCLAPDGSLPDREAVGAVVALAFPGRLARRVAGNGPETYLLASGTRAGLPAGSSLTGHEWLAVAEVSRTQGRDAAGTGAVIRAAAPVSRDTAEAAAGHLITDAVEASFIQGRVTARRIRRLGAIVLSSAPVRPSPEEGRPAVAAALAKEGLTVIGWSPEADALRRRLAFLRKELGDPWPDVTDEALLGRLDDWLAPELAELAGGAPTSGIDLAEALRRLLPWPEARRLAELAPERLEVPSGSRAAVTYPALEDYPTSGKPGDPAGSQRDAGPPVVAVKLQECFGLAETPRLVDGRVPVLFHLLSPARRPLAVTDDLTSFWSGPYTQVRAEMRGRYPRHPWPEDPWAAQATAGTKGRK